MRLRIALRQMLHTGDITPKGVTVIEKILQEVEW
jgi:hypothetical protein